MASGFEASSLRGPHHTRLSLHDGNARPPLVIRLGQNLRPLLIYEASPYALMSGPS